jgi:hypothetical protein
VAACTTSNKLATRIIVDKDFLIVVVKEDVVDDE